MNTCAESQSKVCKAYITDCYGYIAQAVNRCNSGERVILKSNVVAMIDKMRALIANGKVEESEVVEIETEKVSKETQNIQNNSEKENLS